MTSKKQNFAVSYFISRALFLGIGFSLIISYSKQDSIIAFILGTLIGLFIMYLIDKINEYKKDKSLNELLKEMKTPGKILRIIFIIYAIVLFINGMTFFQLFVSSFLLSQSPIWFISLPILILILIISKKKLNITFRVAECLFPISLILTLLSLFSLIPYTSSENFLPLFVSKPLDFLRSIIYFASLSATPNLLLLMTKNAKKNTKAYALGSLTLVLKIFSILSILGPTLALIYRFPEYVILKEIKLLDFIEKIENIVGISWILDNFVFIAISSLFLKDLLPDKTKETIHPILIIILFIIIITIIGKDYAYEVALYYSIPIFLAVILILTVPFIFIYTYKHYRKNNQLKKE